VEEFSDIVLTGHEHDFTVRAQRGGRGEVNTYLEAPRFKAHRMSQAASTRFLIDLKAKTTARSTTWSGMATSIHLEASP